MKKGTGFAVMMGLLASFTVQAQGFGTDLIFDNLIANSNLIAHSACSALGIKAGEYFTLTAEANFFAIKGSGNPFNINLSVPGDAHYTFQGSKPSRIANSIQSNSKNLLISMNTDTAAIEIESQGGSGETCVLDRCPFFGACE